MITSIPGGRRAPLGLSLVVVAALGLFFWASCGGSNTPSSRLEEASVLAALKTVRDQGEEFLKESGGRVHVWTSELDAVLVERIRAELGATDAAELDRLGQSVEAPRLPIASYRISIRPQEGQDELFVSLSLTSVRLAYGFEKDLLEDRSVANPTNIQGGLTYAFPIEGKSVAADPRIAMKSN